MRTSRPPQTTDRRGPGRHGVKRRRRGKEAQMLHPDLARALAAAHIEDLHRAAARRHTIRLDSATWSRTRGAFRRMNRRVSHLIAGWRTGAATSDAGRRWFDGVIASREADAYIQATGGHGGCLHSAAVHRGDR